MSWRFWRRQPKNVIPEPQWTDPLDPHTLRPGDPVFDATMRGSAVMGNFGPNGWEFTEYPDKQRQRADD